MRDRGLGVAWLLLSEGKDFPSPSSFFRMKETMVWPTLKGGVKHCDLCKTICRFYLEEEEWAYKKKRYLGRYPFGESYYYREIADSVETLLEFTLAACVGEARHFPHRNQSRKATFSDYTFPTEKERLVFLNRHRKSWEGYSGLCGILRRVSGTGRSLSTYGRSSVYSLALPYNYWLPALYWCREVFKGLWGRCRFNDDSSLSFGGPKWAKAAALALDTAIAWGRLDIKKMVIRADTLVNLCHNNGIMLNKFDCRSYGFNVRKVLDYKREGDSLALSFIEKARMFFCPIYASCSSRIWRQTPILTKGGLVKNEQEEEGEEEETATSFEEEEGSTEEEEEEPEAVW